ncbi:hypothetical protein GQ54DRAFT_328619 [Martensiomyces pterosporus]|nr:hypothetical protein GQ54DRAFT_328619 [Martensiomyces pterosporus]
MDDLLGLDWSSKQGQQQKKQGASSSTGQSAFRPGSMTPNYAPNQAKDDPFGELVSFTSSSSSVAQDKSKLTLRERQQLQEQSRSQSRSPFVAQQGMNSSGQLGKASHTSLSASNPGSDMWNFDALEKAGSPRPASSSPMQHKQSSYSTNANAMDFDPLSRTADTQPSHGKGGVSSTLDSFPGFESTSANRKNTAGLLDDDEPIPMDISPPAAHQQESFSDRDFEIAQIVDYGFSADQARSALEIAGNTRAAIQLLKEQQSAERRMHAGEHTQERRHRPGVASRTKAQHAAYHDDSDGVNSSSDDGDGNGFYYDDARNGNSGSRGNKWAGASTRKQSQQSRHPGSGNIGNADSLIATANEIGSTVWKQANSWFALGKKKISEMQESMQDQRKAKWATDLRNHGWGEDSGASSARQYRDYADSSSDEDAYVSSNRRRPQQAKQAYSPPASARQPTASHQQAPSAAAGAVSGRASAQADPIIDLGGSFDQAQLASRPSQPQRPQKQQQQPQQPQSGSRGVFSAQSSSSLSNPAAIPNVPASVLRESSAAKTSANEQFKLGQFGDAISGYTTAINRVVQHSSIHPLLILLYNNRALAYARNGESKNAYGDCTQSLDLYSRFHANKVIVLETSERINVEEQRCKSLQRRAEAYEASEKYRDALGDWRMLREVSRDPATRQQSVQGIQRCEKALGISQPAKKPAAKKPAEEKPEDIAKVFASISISSVKSTGGFLSSQAENSVAVAEMRKQEQAKRAEDDQKLAILDQVELELKQWKEGKQQNIRALLSSLHTLLPDFKPIGMHEILETNKVKRAYMRAIAKLHPDKLSKDLDVRTKMISASVFSTLNEAWDAFKAQEGVS